MNAPSHGPPAPASEKSTGTDVLALAPSPRAEIVTRKQLPQTAAFVYRYRPPFGTIQLAYQRGTAAFGQRSDQGDTLFLKLTGVF